MTVEYTRMANEPPERVSSAGEVAEALAANRDDFLAFLVRRLRNRELAEDVLQETLARGLSRLDQLRSDASVRAWFYRALRNALVDVQRRRASEAQALERLAVELRSGEPHGDSQSACACVQTVATQLRPEYADVLQQVEVEDMKLKDYAHAAGISPDNAAVRAHRARKALRTKLTAHCGPCAERGCATCDCAPTSQS